MALVLIDRAQETATANTTVSFTLLGANTGYQTLAGVGDTNTTYYGATDGTNWEVGIGTYSTTGPTLTRTTILSSSNSGSAVTFSGTVTVWVDYTASKAVTTDTLSYPPAIGGTTPAAGTFTTLTGNSTSQFGKASANYIQAVGGATTVAPVISAQGSDTDIPLVLQPKGTGALQAQLADGTTVGGNARGAYATDFQRSRASNYSVASHPFGVICGGYDNKTGVSPYVATINATIAQTASTTIYLQSTSGLIKQSQQLVGTNIPSNTFVSSTGISSSAATLTTGSISGFTLTFASSTGATIVAGMALSGGTVQAGTFIVSGSGLTWTVNFSQSATTTTATLYTITVTQPLTISASTSINFNTSMGTVVGGGFNNARGILSFVGGGGDATAFFFGNTAGGDYSVVVGGQTNSCDSSTTYGFVGGGFTNLVTQPYGVVVGGARNSASSRFSAILGGYYGTTRGITGYVAFPACENPLGYSQGLSQGGLLVLGAVTTTATPAVLLSQIFGSASATTQIALPNNSAYYFKGSVIANVTGAANGAAWSFEGAIMRGANAASTVFIGTPQLNRVAATAGASAWSIALTANTTNGTLTVTVTGAAATTIRWVAKIETTEVTY